MFNNHIVSKFHFLRIIISVLCRCQGVGPGAVVKAAPAWKVGDHGFEPHSSFQVPKKQNVSSPLTRKNSILWGGLRDREVACSTSNRQGLNLESGVWRAVSSHHPQEVPMAQFSLYVHKGGLKPIH